MSFTRTSIQEYKYRIHLNITGLKFFIEWALNIFQLVFRQWGELHRGRRKSISFSARNPLILSTK